MRSTDFGSMPMPASQTQLKFTNSGQINTLYWGRQAFIEMPRIKIGAMLIDFRCVIYSHVICLSLTPYFPVNKPLLACALSYGV